MTKQLNDDPRTRYRKGGTEDQEQSQPGLTTDNGIGFIGTERAAWFKDSEGNTICISQTIS